MTADSTRRLAPPHTDCRGKDAYERR